MNIDLVFPTHILSNKRQDSNVVLQWGRLDSDKESESGSASDDSASSEDEKSVSVVPLGMALLNSDLKTVKAALHDIKWLEKSLEVYL